MHPPFSTISPWNVHDATVGAASTWREIGCFEVERNVAPWLHRNSGGTRRDYRSISQSHRRGWHTVHRYEFPVARPFRFPPKIIATPAARKYWMVIAEQPRFLGCRKLLRFYCVENRWIRPVPSELKISLYGGVTALISRRDSKLHFMNFTEVKRRAFVYRRNRS